MNRQFREIDRHFPDRLDRIGVKEESFGAAKSGDLSERKNNAGLVVRPHHRNDRGVGPDGSFQFAKIEMTLLINRDDRRLAATPNERPAVIQNRVVLDGGGDDVTPLGRHLEGGMERRVVRFRPAAGENNFARLAAEQGRHPLMRRDSMPPSPARRNDVSPRDCRIGWSGMASSPPTPRDRSGYWSCYRDK